MGVDDPYYASFDACSFETDSDDSCLEKVEKMKLKVPNTKRKKHPQRESYLIPTLRKLCGNWVWFLKVLKSFGLEVTKYAIQRGFRLKTV